MSLQNREFSLIIVDVGSAGLSGGRGSRIWRARWCERKNELLEGLFFLFFWLHKDYNGISRNGQDKSVLFFAARCHRLYLDVEILICRICAGDRNFNLLANNWL